MLNVAGLEIAGIPDDHQILEIMVIAKCLDAEGVVGYIPATSPDLLTVEALGMLDFAQVCLRNGIVVRFAADTDEDES